MKNGTYSLMFIGRVYNRYQKKKKALGNIIQNSLYSLHHSFTGPVTYFSHGPKRRGSVVANLVDCNLESNSNSSCAIISNLE